MTRPRPARRRAGRIAAAAVLVSTAVAGTIATAPGALAAGTLVFSQPSHGRAGIGQAAPDQCRNHPGRGIFASTSVPTSRGLDVTFNSYQYGGISADGIAFVLAAVDPANPQTPSIIGQSGGALGYSAKASVTPALAIVAASGFTAGPAPAIPAADAVYGINGFVFTTGDATFTSTPVTRPSAAAQVVVTAARASGTNSVTWNPTVAVSVPASAVGGVYSATLTSSVS